MMTATDAVRLAWGAPSRVLSSLPRQEHPGALSGTDLVSIGRGHAPTSPVGSSGQESSNQDPYGGHE